MANACCDHRKSSSIFKNKSLIISFFLIVILISASVFPILLPFKKSFLEYFRIIWWAILLGLVLGGVIEYFIPRQYVSTILATKSKRSIFNAVLLGFFMSVCSHGILALAIQLHKKGASVPSVIAFLMASPWANLPLTFMLIGFFGLVKALYIIFVAIIIAVITGFIFQLLESKGLIEVNPNTHALDDNFSIRADVKRRWATYDWSIKQLIIDVKGVYSGSIALANMVLWWILMGMGIASLVAAFMPEGFMHQYMGPSAFGLGVTLFIATVMEVCSEGTAPLAFEIFKQTGALGNAFVFLMAGVATDYTEIGLIWHNVGKRTAIWLPIITVPQIILFGIIANHIF